MKLKRGLAIIVSSMAAAATLAACGGSTGEGGATTEATTTGSGATTAAATTAAASSSNASGEKVIRWGYSWGYPSLDVHADYNGWNTAAMGLSESLFSIDENLELQPCLATEATTEDGITWNVTMNEKAAFSNGNPVTSDVVIENLQRLGETNESFSRFKDCTYTKTSDTQFTIVSPDAYPTLKNDLASPEAGIMDIANSVDINNAPICTGPFVVKSFTPNADQAVAKNENYWNGDVLLDGGELLVMSDDDSKLMALQNGEIDFYDNVSVSSKAVLETDPTFTIYNTPTTRLQFYSLNTNNLSDNVRAAINYTIDKQQISDFLEGVTTVTDTPYLPDSEYGQAKGKAVDTAKAEELLQADGYTKNSSGVYEKDGKPLNISIKYYAARELDKVATLMSEQLAKIGVQSTLGVEEDADAGYMGNGDYDIGLYCMITDKTGDPAYFINSTLAEGSAYSKGGFKSDECQALIDQLNVEVDEAKRAELANQIIQISIDKDAFGYVGFLNRVMATKQGVKNVSENYPFDLYGLFKDSDM